MSTHSQLAVPATLHIEIFEVKGFQSLKDGEGEGTL